jgi:hypothetical protein
MPGLDPLSIASMGVQGVTGLISTVNGLFQKARANRLAKANIRPTYQIPDEIKANQVMAQQMAKSGMSATQYGQQAQAIGRGANAAMANAQDRRAGLAAIGSVQQNTNDANLKLNVADNSARLNNMRSLMQQNSVLAQFKDKAFAWNKQAKFQENAAAIRALQGAGNANINAGLNSIGSAGAMAVAGQWGSKGTGTTAGTTGSTETPPMSVADFLAGSKYAKAGWANAALPEYDVTQNYLTGEH